MRDEMQESCPYLRLLAQYLDCIADVDEMLVLREDVDGTNRVIVPTSLIVEVIDEAHQGPGAAHEGVRKVPERLVYSYYWPGMKRDLQLQLATCPTWINFPALPKCCERS